MALAQEEKRAPAAEPTAEPPAEPPRLKDRGPTGINNPPSGLWGSSPDSENEGGLPKATGSAYNYTHIALGAGVIACTGIALFVLIRRISAARKRAG